MKATVRIVSIATVLALMLGVLGAGAAFAQARDASWVVSVTYQNVGTAAATVIFDFYAEGSGTPISINPLGTGNTLAAGAGASFFIGGVNELPAGFRGSAVVSSDQPLVATAVQFSQAAGFKVRLLSNSFQSTDASNQFLIPSVLEKRFNETTIFSIQNTENQDILATVKLYDADNAGAQAASKDWLIHGGSSKYIEMDNPALTGLPASTTTFNGSAILTAVMNSDKTTPAKVVAASSGLYTNKNIGANVEGVPLSRAANTLYMATALCRAFGLDVYYAVQNASLTSSGSVTVNYFNLNGSPAGTDGPYTIGHGQKKSIAVCDHTAAGFSGSATITSVGAPIVALGKASVSLLSPRADTADTYTAFLGEPGGSSKSALPYIRWASDADYLSSSNVGGAQRATLAIQNLEQTATIKVNVKYYGNSGGSPIATEQLTIAPKSKGNSSPVTASALGKQGMKAGSFGYYTDGKFGGAVVIEADPSNPNAKFIAIARVQAPGVAEDYNAVAVP